MSSLTWRIMLRTPQVWKIFILTQKLFQEWVMPLNRQETKQIFLSVIILIEVTQLCWKQWKWIRHIYEVRTLQRLESLRSFIFLVWFKVPVILPGSSCCFTKHLLVSEKRFFSWRAIKKRHFICEVTVFDRINSCLELWILSNIIKFFVGKKNRSVKS